MRNNELQQQLGISCEYYYYYYVCICCTFVRRPDHIYTSTAFLPVYELCWCRNSIPTHPFTNDVSSGHPLNCLICLLKKVQRWGGSISDEPHLRFLPPVLPWCPVPGGCHPLSLPSSPFELHPDQHLLYNPARPMHRAVTLFLGGIVSVRLVHPVSFWMGAVWLIPSCCFDG